ncbi:MAG: TetR/AcrR family transcriptional regulator [Angelakisella sp.]
MNHPAISREQLLEAAEEIVRSSGLEELNIRRLAASCGISVGCLYNYFPAKADLILALTENLWKRTFAEFMTAPRTGDDSFVQLVDGVYHHLLTGLHRFTAGFLQQLSAMQLSDKHRGRRLEQHYFGHMKHQFLQCLQQDAQVPPTLWDSMFTPERYVDFVFAAMMTSLRRDEPDCDFLLEVIRRTLYC